MGITTQLHFTVLHHLIKVAHNGLSRQTEPNDKRYLFAVVSKMLFRPGALQKLIWISRYRERSCSRSSYSEFKTKNILFQVSGFWFSQLNLYFRLKTLVDMSSYAVNLLHSTDDRALDRSLVRQPAECFVVHINMKLRRDSSCSATRSKWDQIQALRPTGCSFTGGNTVPRWFTLLFMVESANRWPVWCAAVSAQQQLKLSVQQVSHRDIQPEDRWRIN